MFIISQIKLTLSRHLQPRSLRSKMSAGGSVMLFCFAHGVELMPSELGKSTTADSKSMVLGNGKSKVKIEPIGTIKPVPVNGAS